MSSCVVACFFVDFGEFLCGVWRGFGDVYLFFFACFFVDFCEFLCGGLFFRGFW